MNQARSVVHEFSNCYFPMVLALFKVFFVFYNRYLKMIRNDKTDFKIKF